ncbi:hypothetical protein V1477_012517 [Vespula maculifrons]|uniref:Uncharacterized protein n=1 Tax=Vespula maculifrons TaxID=7453 RepID=A0ABD2BXP4_VESMC
MIFEEEFHRTEHSHIWSPWETYLTENSNAKNEVVRTYEGMLAIKEREYKNGCSHRIAQRFTEAGSFSFESLMDRCSYKIFKVCYSAAELDKKIRVLPAGCEHSEGQRYLRILGEDELEQE